MAVSNTIENEAREITFNPVSPTTTFALPFPVYSADNQAELQDDFVVCLNGVEQPGFTVSGTFKDGVSTNAAIVFPSPGVTGEVKIVSARGPRSTIAVAQGRAMTAKELTSALNSILASARDLHGYTRRCLNYGEGLDVVTPARIVPGSNYILQFNNGPPWRLVAVPAVTFEPTDTYTPIIANTYASSLRQKLEWDELTAFDFISNTQRVDPSAVDCWEGLQNGLDFLRDNQTGVHCPIKHFRLNGGTFRLSQTLVVTGTRTGDGPRQGRTLIVGGSLVAADSWADQTTNPDPLIEFGGQSQGSGLRDVYVDSNGVCSGVLVRSGEAGDDGGIAKVLIDNCVIVNFANPEAPFQTDLYTNTVAIGVGNSASEFPARKYEIGYDALTPSASVAPSPYGIRVGTKDLSDGTIKTSTFKLSGTHIRQWELGRTELASFRRRTGIGVWLCASDARLSGETNNVADCLKSLVVDGHSNFIQALHTSPVDEVAADYDVDDAPTSDIFVIGTENRDGINYYQGVYNERLMLLHSTKAYVLGCHFPRNPNSIDKNSTVGAIILDANSVGAVPPGADRLLIANCRRSSLIPYTFSYREEDGNSWATKVDLTQVNDNEIFSTGALSFASQEGSGAVGNVLSSADDRATLGYRAKLSSKTVRVGIDTDRLIVLLDNVPIMFADASGITDPSGVVIVTSRQRLAIQLDATNVTLVSVFSAATLTAGKKYEFSATLLCALDATGGFKIAVDGSATATSIGYFIKATKVADGTGLFGALGTALGTSHTYATETSVVVEIKGSILVNAGGTFNVKFAQSTGAGTSSVLVGSTFEVKETL